MKTILFYAAFCCSILAACNGGVNSASDEDDNEAKSEGQKVINNAKEKAEQLLGDVEELMGQIKGKK